MPEDPNRREPVRLMTSTRAAAMSLALLAVVLGGVLLLTLWSTGLAADRSLGWRWGSVATAALGFLFLAWAVIAAFGVFTHASASPADPGFLPVQPPKRLVKRRGSQPRDDLQKLLYRTAISLGAEAISTEQKTDRPHAPEGKGKDSARTGDGQLPATPKEGESSQETKVNQPAAPAKEPEFELNYELKPGWVILAPAESSLPDVGQDTPRDTGNGKSLVFPSAVASGLLAPRNHWIARVWLRAAGERVAVGALATVVAVLLIASGRVAHSSSNSGTSRGSSSSSGTTGGSSSNSATATSPASRSGTTGNSSSGSGTSSPRFPLSTALVSDVVGGFADALGPPVGALAKTAVNTATAPDELQNKLLDLALDHVVTPFLDAGSEKLGDAFADALVQGTGLKPKSPPPTPSTKAVTQVQSRLQIKLTNELAAMPDIRAAAKKAGLPPSQLAAELAAEIAEGLARALADGLVQLSPSSHLNDSSIASVAKQFATKQLSPQPPATGAYTVKPGDSLWNISQRLLGPGATARQIEQTSHLIYHDNQTTIGANPNHLVPGQVLRIPSTRESALSQGWVLLPCLLVAPGTLAGIEIRRRRRSKRRPAVLAEVKASITLSAPDHDSQVT